MAPTELAVDEHHVIAFVTETRVVNPLLHLHFLDATMSDLATVRAEIKGWERSFRATQGREPTVDDIKRLPDIGMTSQRILCSRLFTLSISQQV